MSGGLNDQGWVVLMQRIKDYSVYLALRIFICVIQTMRMDTCRQFAKLLAFLVCNVLRIRRAVVEDNLQHAFPDWSAAKRRQVTQEMWEHLVILICEIAHVPRTIQETNWRKYIHIHRKREMVRYLLDPRPLVIVSGHFGNFEVAGYTAGLLGFPTYAIARPLDNPYLDRFFSRFRGSKGQFMLPKDGSADKIQRVFDSGGTLALLGDQYAGPKGCWVEFMGRPASCHKALAVFTLTAGAPLIVSYAERLDRPLKFEVGVEGIVDPMDLNDSVAGVKPLTQWYNTMLEQLIRRRPEQYWWVHRRWKGQPAQRRKKKPPSAQTADRLQKPAA